MCPILKLDRMVVNFHLYVWFSASNILTCLKDTLLIPLPHVCCFQKYQARNTTPNSEQSDRTAMLLGRDAG